jgi:hypothetical protein
MKTDLHFYAWLGWFVSWMLLPYCAIGSLISYRKNKKRINLLAGMLCIVMFALKIIYRE